MSEFEKRQMKKYLERLRVEWQELTVTEVKNERYLGWHAGV